MAKVSDSVTWASFETPLKAYLGIADASEDAELKLWLRTATKTADRYLNNDFKDDDGNDIVFTDADGGNIPVPEDVLQGVYEFVRIMRELRNKPFGLTGRKTGDASEQYAFGSRIKGGEAGPLQVLEQVKGFWVSERKNVWM